MGIVRDKSVLQTSVPPEQREPRVYNPDGKVLVIVESPAKSKTIEKFLGPNYVVKASMGHLRDLPKSQMGIDIEHGFTPRYSNLVTRKKVIDELVPMLMKAAPYCLQLTLTAKGKPFLGT